MSEDLLHWLNGLGLLMPVRELKIVTFAATRGTDVQAAEGNIYIRQGGKTEGWEKFHSEQISGLYSQNIISIIKSRNVR
jgi:hypothetical protein